MIQAMHRLVCAVALACVAFACGIGARGTLDVGTGSSADDDAGGGQTGTRDAADDTDVPVLDAGADVSVDGAPSVGWAKKRKLTVDNTAGTAPLANVAVMVKLDPSRIDYASTGANGADLRFTDASGAVLAHEIESWAPGATSIVWVGVPAIAASASVDLWMFHANPAALDAQEPASVWDATYVGVWHLPAARDSAKAHVSTSSGATATTRFGNPALAFSGSQHFDTGASEYLAKWTLEAWLRATNAAQSSTTPTGPISRGDNYQLQWHCNSSTYCRTANVLVGGTYEEATLGSMSAGTWYHVVATYDGNQLATYVNGALIEAKDVGGPPGNFTGSAWIGRGRIAGAGTFAGDIDEVRISTDARPAAYASFHYRSTNDTLVTYGAELPNPSLALAP